MKLLTYGESVVLGVIQGVTEFLPISSSGHLALVQRWLALDPDSPALLLFDVMTHVGTLAAVIVVFRESLVRFLSSLWNRGRGRSSAARVLVLVVLALVPTAVIGLAFQDTLEAAFGKPKWIGTCLIVTGLLLAVLSQVPRGRRGWRRFSWWRAVLVGVAQAVAILPGISRSGATICVASYCGMRRRWAVEFSFLIAAPAILGGMFLKLRDTWSLPADQLSGIAKGPLLLGTLVSFLVGIAALRLLVAAVRRAKLHYFAFYCWLLGAIVLLGWR